MKMKAIEILRAIADDNDNKSHTSLSLGYQCAVRVAISELEQPEPSVPHPLVDAINTHIKRVIEERLEAALNASLDETDQRIDDLDRRLQVVENAENEDVADLQSRVEDLESAERNREDDNDLECRIDDLESAQEDNALQIDEIKLQVKEMGESNANGIRQTAIAIIDYIRERIA